MVRLICEIGTSFAVPSNGFLVLSPTCSKDVYTQKIRTLKDTASQPYSFKYPGNAIVEFVKFLKHAKRQKETKSIMKNEFIVANCRGYVNFLM